MQITEEIVAVRRGGLDCCVVRFRFWGCSRERRLNHRVAVTGGVLEPECGELLREFFRKKRKAALRLAEDPAPDPGD